MNRILGFGGAAALDCGGRRVTSSSARAEEIMEVRLVSVNDSRGEKKRQRTARTPKRKRGRQGGVRPKVLECVQSSAAFAPGGCVTDSFNRTQTTAFDCTPGNLTEIVIQLTRI